MDRNNNADKAKIKAHQQKLMIFFQLDKVSTDKTRYELPEKKAMTHKQAT